MVLVHYIKKHTIKWTVKIYQNLEKTKNIMSKIHNQIHNKGKAKGSAYSLSSGHQIITLAPTISSPYFGPWKLKNNQNKNAILQ